MALSPPTLSRIVGLVILALWGFHLGLTSPVSASENSALVTNAFYDADLRQALSDIAFQTGETIVVAPEVSGYVSCELNAVPLVKALGILLAGTGYYSSQCEGYWLVASADPKKPSFAASSKTRLVKLNYSSAESVKGLLSSAYSRYVKTDKDSNSLSITAPKPLLETIVAEILNFDQPPRHIILDAMIVIMEKRDLLNLGVQWGLPTVQAGFYGASDARGKNTGFSMFGGSLPWGIQVGYSPNKAFTNALQMSLNMLSQNDEATIVASPQIMAQDGKEATVKVTTEEYFEILTKGYYRKSELEKIEAGTILKIKPQIGANGDVTLDIHTEVSDVVARSGKNLPVVTRRRAESTVRVKDGGTAVIAGLLESRAFLTQDKVPGFSKLPGVGRMFQNNNTRESTRQVAVFVTARLLQTTQDAAKLDKRSVYKPISEEIFKPQLAAQLEKIFPEQTEKQ